LSIAKKRQVWKDAAVSKTSRKSLADRAKKGAGTGCLRLFFLPFFLIGSGFLYWLTIRPALDVIGASDWQQTPCVIESSKVVSHPGSESTTYSIGIVYRYTFDDRPYTSKRYDFGVGSTSGRKNKAAVVARYPAGTQTTCYVNPAVPHEAVIERSFPASVAFGGIGLVFALAGGLGMIFAPRLVASKQSSGSVVPRVEASTGAPVVLRPKTTPRAKFLGMLAFSLVWNVFMSFFIYMVFFDDDSRRVPFFAKAVITILTLIGIGTIFGVFTTFLALFNPRIRLTAPTTTVPLGGEIYVTWTVTGRTGMLHKLRIILEGREEATYQRGTRTSTDTQAFIQIPVFESAEREFLAQGSARVAVPVNSMHTFEANRNKVLWRLKVQGEIPRWPDVEDEYPIAVLPLPLRN
jgi:hypothetical protein